MSKSSTGVDMFQFIADTVAQLPKTDDHDANAVLPLGFTFSFPCKQYRLNAGDVATLDEGFRNHWGCRCQRRYAVARCFPREQHQC